MEDPLIIEQLTPFCEVASVAHYACACRWTWDRLTSNRRLRAFHATDDFWGDGRPEYEHVSVLHLRSLSLRAELADMISSLDFFSGCLSTGILRLDRVQVLLSLDSTASTCESDASDDSHCVMWSAAFMRFIEGTILSLTLRSLEFVANCCIDSDTINVILSAIVRSRSLTTLTFQFPGDTRIIEHLINEGWEKTHHYGLRIEDQEKHTIIRVRSAENIQRRLALVETLGLQHLDLVLALRQRILSTSSATELGELNRFLDQLSQLVSELRMPTRGENDLGDEVVEFCDSIASKLWSQGWRLDLGDIDYWWFSEAPLGDIGKSPCQLDTEAPHEYEKSKRFTFTTRPEDIFTDIVIEYILSGDRYKATILCCGRSQTLDLGNASAIDRKIHLFNAIGQRVFLFLRKRRTQWLFFGTWLCHRLFDRVISCCFVPVSTVSVVCDGGLCHLPLHALPRSLCDSMEKVRFLMDDYTFVYVPSLLNQNPYLIKQQKHIELTANHIATVISCSKHYRLPDLLFAEIEGRAITEQLVKAGVQVTTNGSWGNLRDTLKRFAESSIIHIATHGFVDKHGVAGLVLCDESDCVLTAEDIRGLCFQGASLLVLSSCATGTGTVTDQTDSWLRLWNAFLAAGVSTVVAPMWPVLDKETSILMQSFYSFLLDGMTVACALQTAQRSLRRHNALQSRWCAGFVTYGYSNLVLTRASSEVI